MIYSEKDINELLVVGLKTYQLLKKRRKEELGKKLLAVLSKQAEIMIDTSNIRKKYKVKCFVCNKLVRKENADKTMMGKYICHNCLEQAKDEPCGFWDIDEQGEPYWNG